LPALSKSRKQKGLNFVVDKSLVAMEDGVDREDYKKYKYLQEQDEASQLVLLVKGVMIYAENAVVGSPTTQSKQVARPKLY
jgi:hypothetical protein